MKSRFRDKVVAAECAKTKAANRAEEQSRCYQFVRSIQRPLQHGLGKFKTQWSCLPRTGAWPPQVRPPPPLETGFRTPFVFTSLTAYHSTLFLPRPARAIRDAQQRARIGATRRHDHRLRVSRHLPAR